VKFFYILDDASHGRWEVESPGHFARSAQAGEAIVNGADNFGMEIVDHFVRFKNAIAEVRFVPGDMSRPFKLSSLHSRTLRSGSCAQELHVDVKRDSADWPPPRFHPDD
jgi:hypothetical protein